jgi:hypothetical protein
MTIEYSHRLAIDISDEQKVKLDKHLGIHGLKRAVFLIILDDLLNMIEEHGQLAIGAILAGQCKPREIIPCMCKAERIVNDKGNDR